MKVVSLKAEHAAETTSIASEKRGSISANPDENGVFKVEFSDGPSLILSTDYLDENVNLSSWEEGRELSPREEETLCFAAGCYKAEKVALRLIARAEQSSLSLTAKLEKRGIEIAVAKTVIALLLDRKLLDDARYAELWVRSCLTRKTPSPLWLLASLGKKGIDRDSSRSAIQKVLDEETEYTMLLKYIEKMDILDKNGAKGGLKAHLKYQGFSIETITRFFD